MTEQAWSKEPWIENIFAVRDGDGNVIWLVGWPNSRRGYFLSFENRMRAFSCVNALAGVSRPEGIPALIHFTKNVCQMARALEMGDLDALSRLSSMGPQELGAGLARALRACGIEP